MEADVKFTIVSCLVVLLADEGSTFWTTCSTESVGYSATVKCTFSEDLDLTKTVSAVSVQRYSLNESDTEADTVAQCFWVNGESRGCAALIPGYKCHPVASKILTVSLPHMRDQFEGRYLCYVNLVNQTTHPDHNFCYLTSHKEQVTESQPANTTQISIPMTQPESSNNTGWILAVVVLSLIALIAAGVVVIEKFCKDKCSAPNSSDDVEAHEGESLNGDNGDAPAAEDPEHQEC